jgi:antitoxin (DNA-binding transcriptional repressor) of toxin-antitoxin stability system
MSTRSDDLAAHSAVSDLAAIFDVVPIAEVRADLSRTVERVATTGRAVIVARHDRPRVAIVPLDVLARDRARFVAGAEARRSADEPDRPPADDLPFEAVEGLSAGALRRRRLTIEGEAIAEDVVAAAHAPSRGWAIEQIFEGPVFERAVARAVGQMLLQRGPDD